MFCLILLVFVHKGRLPFVPLIVGKSISSKRGILECTAVMYWGSILQKKGRGADVACLPFLTHIPVLGDKEVDITFPECVQTEHGAMAGVQIKEDFLSSKYAQH